METEITALLELVAQFGFSSVFLWLFVREMNRHDETRKEYRQDMRERIRYAETERLHSHKPYANESTDHHHDTET